MAKTTEIMEIKPIDMKIVEVTIVGDTPLIMHAWSEKAKRMMLEAQQGKSKGKKKEAKNPVEDFIQSLYWISGKPELSDNASEEECEIAFENAIKNGASFGFPASAIKKAAIDAAFRMGWSKDKASLKGVFFIESDYNDLVLIKSDKPIMREDMVRIVGTADLRYRGELRNWSATFRIKYNASGKYSLENIINIINAGGIVCGIGEWRPEKDGQFGTYHIQSV